MEKLKQQMEDQKRLMEREMNEVKEKMERMKTADAGQSSKVTFHIL